MTGIEFETEGDALILKQAIDQAFGYPNAETRTETACIVGVAPSGRPCVTWADAVPRHHDGTCADANPADYVPDHWKPYVKDIEIGMYNPNL